MRLDYPLAPRETPIHHTQKICRNGRVGVQKDQRIARFAASLNLINEPLQRVPFAYLLRVRALMDDRPGGAADLSRAVATVIGGDMDAVAVGRVVEPSETGEEERQQPL